MATPSADQGSLFGPDPGEEVSAGPPPSAPSSPDARSTDPATSHAAGRAARIGFSRYVFQVLWLYAGYGEIDEDAWKRSAELEDGQWKEGTVAKRRHRAMERGLIERVVSPLTGQVETRRTDHGQEAIIWRLTDEGRKCYAAWLQEAGDPRRAE